MRVALLVLSCICVGSAASIRSGVLGISHDAVGCAVLCACVGTLVLSSARLTRRLFPSDDLLLGLIATITLYQSLAATVVVCLGLFTALSLAAQLFVTGLIGAIAAAIPVPARGELSYHHTAEMSGIGARVGWAALIAAFLAFAETALNLVRHIPIDANNMWYHFPMIAEWARTGSTWPADSIPLIARAYPGFREAGMTFLTLPLGHEHLAITGLLELPLFAAVLWQLLREFNVPVVLVASVVGYALTAPQVMGAGTGNDLCLAVEFLTAVLFLARLQRQGIGADALIAGCALGSLAATKYSGVVYAALIASLFLLQHLLAYRRTERSLFRLKSLGRWCLVAAATLVVAGPWYVRNCLTFGNPLYPAEIRIGGMLIFPGPYGADYFAADTLKWNVTPLVENWRRFTDAYGWLIVGIGFGAPLLAGASLIRWRFLLSRLPLALLPVAAFLAFLHQPYNVPLFGYHYSYNMRYLIGWFAVSLAFVVVVLGKALSPRPVLGLSVVFLGGTVLNVAARSSWWALIAVAAVAAGAAAPLLMAGLRAVRSVNLRRPGLLVLAGLTAAYVAAVGLAALRERNQYQPNFGYRDLPSSRGWGAVARYIHANLDGQRIAVTGSDRSFPFYGNRFGNSVFLVPNKLDLEGLLIASRAGGATVLVCLNPIVAHNGLGDFQFGTSAGPALLRRHPKDLSVLYASDGAFVLKLEPGGSDRASVTGPHRDATRR